ncbi:MAG: glutamate-1-semialdehyde-2,1-aminomutase [Flavobacteriales bacterium]|nr:glutamate-1-semialdehyde-2,1-aminomutase [Flavobacteriales bacterium]|tara:strand:+ start:6662 stop:7948 length:1287 start_codon:yes stop_codon:yes gene_type:complete
MIKNNSIKAFEEAKKFIAGGVNSPVRSFKQVNSNPIFFKKGKGCYLTDVDENIYIDCVSSWGPLLFGHCDENLIKSITDCAKNSTTFGAPTILENQMAKKIIELVPSIDLVRMVNSGTEATMSAIRLARGYTNKNLILKFSGNYHGHGDSFLTKSGSGLMGLNLPNSLGVTKNTAKETLNAEFNNISSVKDLVKKYNNKIAAVIIEPIAGNMGLVKSKINFLKNLRQICDENEILLIFDEVMSGFRVAKGGAQEIYGVTPDLTTLGKIIGGGLPVGAYGGKRKIMEKLAPNGPVYQAGTLSGNPLAMSAGLSILNKLNDNVFSQLEETSSNIQEGIEKIIKKYKTKAIIQRQGSMMTLFFTNLKNIRNYKDAQKCNISNYSKYFNIMLENGVYLPPSQFEAMFISTAIKDNDINKIIHANEIALKKIK